MPLQNVPDEILVKIFLYCDPFERKLLSLVNRRFLMIHRRLLPVKFRFHIQGNTDNLLEHGLKTLMITDTERYDTVQISRFDLTRSLDKRCVYEKLFNQSLKDYAKPNIRDLIINECVITFATLNRLRLLFPDIRSLSILRCFLTEDDMIQNTWLPTVIDQQEENVVPSNAMESNNRLEEVVVSNPLYSNLRPERLFVLLKDFCGPNCHYFVEDSPVSHKRAVSRRFCRALKTKNSQELNRGFAIDAKFLFDVMD